MGAVVRLVSGRGQSTPHPSLTGRTCCSAPRTGGGKTVSIKDDRFETGAIIAGYADLPKRFCWSMSER